MNDSMSEEFSDEKQKFYEDVLNQITWPFCGLLSHIWKRSSSERQDKFIHIFSPNVPILDDYISLTEVPR